MPARRERGRRRALGSGALFYHRSTVGDGGWLRADDAQAHPVSRARRCHVHLPTLRSSLTMTPPPSAHPNTDAPTPQVPRTMRCAGHPRGARRKDAGWCIPTVDTLIVAADAVARAAFGGANCRHGSRVLGGGAPAHCPRASPASGAADHKPSAVQILSPCRRRGPPPARPLS